MANPLKNLETPELFFGFVSAVGANINDSMSEFRAKLQSLGYRVIDVSVTEYFEKASQKIAPKETLVRTPEYDRIKSHIAYGNQLRTHFDDASVLTSLAVYDIAKKRKRPNVTNAPAAYEGTAYLL